MFRRHRPRQSPARRLQSGAGATTSPGMPSFEEIVADFAFLDDWDERYKYLIDLGRRLPPYPEEKRDEARKVRGCASQVWLDVRVEGGRLRFLGDSDAHIVKGLVAVVLALFDDKAPADIASVDAAAALAPLDLGAHLTPQRSNGLAAMVRRIRDIAASTAADGG